MKRLFITATLCLAAPALAGPEAPSGTPDMTSVGPLSRKVTKPDNRAIEALYQASDEAWMKGDIKAVAAMHDFPVLMTTDDAKGEVHSERWSREQFVQIMGPMAASAPKDIRIRHRLTPHFISDSLAVVIDDATMLQGKKELGSFKSAALVVNRKGKWLFKGGVEAGWGEMPTQQTSATKP